MMIRKLPWEGGLTGRGGTGYLNLSGSRKHNSPLSRSRADRIPVFSSIYYFERHPDRGALLPRPCSTYMLCWAA